MAIDKGLRREAMKEARRRGVSLSSLMNEALEKLLTVPERPRRCTIKDLIAILDEVGPLPDVFVADVRKVIKNQGSTSRNRWGF